MNRHRPEEMRFFKEAVFNYKLYAGQANWIRRDQQSILYLRGS